MAKFRMYIGFDEEIIREKPVSLMIMQFSITDGFTDFTKPEFFMKIWHHIRMKYYVCVKNMKIYRMIPVKEFKPKEI